MNNITKIADLVDGRKYYVVTRTGHSRSCGDENKCEFTFRKEMHGLVVHKTSSRGCSIGGMCYTFNEKRDLIHNRVRVFQFEDIVTGILELGDSI